MSFASSDMEGETELGMPEEAESACAMQACSQSLAAVEPPPGPVRPDPSSLTVRWTIDWTCALPTACPRLPGPAAGSGPPLARVEASDGTVLAQGAPPSALPLSARLFAAMLPLAAPIPNGI